jgi:lipoprotein-anchoring transpeptidase ErfK/SrfK
VVAAVLSACAGGSPTSTGSAGSVSPVPATEAAAVTPGVGSETSPSSPARRAVSVHGKLVVRRQAASTAAVALRLPATTALGSPRVLLVEKTVPGWVQVQLPTRPNGSTGWVEAAQVRVETVDDQITVDLAARRMTLVIDGQPLTTTPVAIGSAADPTPTGRFYVTDRVRPPDPGGSYGAFALGLSAHSTTLSEFGSGDGQVGIHGTNEPGSIGKAVSHGCIRVPAEAASLLARVPLGTPVTIT